MRSLRARFGGLLPLVVAAIVLGALLRLVWPNDIHYLGDEAWTFRHVQDARNGGAWEALGMPSSRGVRNPGMSVWVFAVLGIVSGASTPAGLTRAVAVLALAGHLLMLLVPDQRRTWTWAFVLVATNPIVVFLERKIWAQSVLPVFMVGMIVAWMRRGSRGGAFAWGALGAIVGQIHMAGFFFAPALAAFTKIWGDERGPRARWLAWLLGSAAGALPALPWVLYLAHDRPPPTGSPWWLRFRLEFYQYFLSDPTGLAGEYVLAGDLGRAMKWPMISGHPTYLLLVSYVALGIVTVGICRRALLALWENRTNLRALVTGAGGDTRLLLAAALVGMGVLMTLPSIAIHRHYMLAAFPLPFVLFAHVALLRPGGERWLVGLFAGCAVATASMLAYVHDAGETPEMGKTYATQLRLGIQPEDAKPVGHP